MSGLFEKLRLGIVLIFVVACFLWGGGSRLDIPGLILLQPLSVICAIGLLLVPGPIRWESVRVPLLLVLALGVIIALQLLPLPPAIWTQLPGHQTFLPVAAIADGNQLWRPLSLTPDETLASLVGLCVPVTALVGYAGLTEKQGDRLLTWLLVAALISAIFGILQLLGGSQSGFYRYAITNNDSAVGLFSNRNHQALFLVVTWPLLALWATQSMENRAQYRARLWIAIAVGVALMPVLVASGSRGGVLLAIPAVAMAWYILDGKRSPSPSQGRARHAMLRYALPVLGIVSLVAVATILPRDFAIHRLNSTNIGDDLRLAYLPTVLRITVDFLPFGSGFGSFDPVFRSYEPDELLDPAYFNHAHNDLLELIMTGGIPALLIVIVFILWMARRVIATIRVDRFSPRGRFSLVAATIVALVLLSSLIDYPLRTPVFSMIFAFACGWLGADRHGSATVSGKAAVSGKGFTAPAFGDSGGADRLSAEASGNVRPHR